MVDISKYEVPVDKLRWHCDPCQFEFECTSELSPLEEFIGQDRAIRAIEFGLAMDRPGYNIYVAGLTGTGKTSAVKTYIQRLIHEKEAKSGTYRPDDWCYLYNLNDPDQPQIVNLPQGKGRQLRDQINNLLERLKRELTRAFSSEDYNSERKRSVEQSQDQQREIFEELGKRSRERGFLFQITPSGPLLVPLVEGRPMTQEEYLALEENAQEVIESTRAELFKDMEASFERVRTLEKETADKLRDMDRRVGDFAISVPFQELLQEYGDIAKARRYTEDLKSYTLDNLNVFKEQEAQSQPQLAPLGIGGPPFTGGRDPLLPFRVNVFVDNSETVGPPVIIESNPTYGNMFGKTERRFFLGGYLSDHTMLKSGALGLANGGYLLVNARDVLLNAGVWESLKRVIRNKEIRVEDPFEQFGLIAPQGLRPQPMPVDVKVVLIGDNQIYQGLSAYDEDFWEIFKVKADFDFEIEKTDANMSAYACFIGDCCREEGLKHFDTSGVAKTMEHGARLVEDQERLSSRFSQIEEIVVEADYWARKDGSELVSGKHVERAIEEKIYRHNLIDERLQEAITRGTIMIDVAGAVVGQVNGLSVYSLGDITFGKPSRITAKTFMGRSGVINIERESQLSGRIHDKGVLILSGYLGWKYAQDKPLSLSASLCFEQSYEGVEGDSASSTELYAILSSLAEVPVKQNIAITGSVNQRGEIQPIGGVNHKIEGFFRVCKAKGLTGDQGVLIPLKNLDNLMLHEEVVEAVRQEQFHVYAVTTIDEGIEVLTEVEAGEKRDDGTYPEGSVNYSVNKRLEEIAQGLKEFYAEEKE